MALVANTPGAIGYSGMGYATAEREDAEDFQARGRAGVAPTVENAKKQRAAIRSPGRCCSTRRASPSRSSRQFLDWILGKPGQKVVLGIGIRAGSATYE